MTRLIPTNQWIYDLYKVTYHRDEDAAAEVTAYITSSHEGHLILDIEDRWPGPWATYYRYERIQENVGHPRVVGSLYGHNLYESSCTHANRLVQKLGLAA